MKIDVHTHTRKCKTGDAPSREVAPQEFCDTVRATDVGIIAITNHNVFDLAQFQEICTTMAGAVQVWPGVELDIKENGARGHLLVIVSPNVAAEFSGLVDALIAGEHPDKFVASIAQVLEKFEHLSPLYIAHYGKKPAISEEDLALLLAGTKRPECVIKEVANAISAGIYISHGHPSIYGSDIHDWKVYGDKARDLPDLRLPVESFEHFSLLLKKDQNRINTVLNKKTAETLNLKPFGDGSTLNIRAFNDINVIFGPKGTGKTCILDAIAKHYSDAGTEAKVYVSASDRLEEIFDVKGKKLTINLNPYGINYCTDEVKLLRAAGEVGITSMEKFTNFFRATHSSTNAQKILLKNIDTEEEIGLEHQFRDIQNARARAEEFLEFISTDDAIKRELKDDELQDITKILSDLLARLQKSAWNSFSEWKVVLLLNSAITTFRLEVERKTGNPAKPTTTGFRDYAMNRIKIEVAAGTILKNLDVKIPPITDQVGLLGKDKGELHFVTSFAFQDGKFTDASYAPVAEAKVKKLPQKKFAMAVRQVQQQVYSDNLFEKISELNNIDDGEGIKTVLELLQFKRHFSLDGKPYAPSSGEASMVMLQKELGVDKEVYILDEPERSLGNEYISDVIVPLIKERARSGRKIFISTHDANIAVRTLPYSSIYRCYDQAGYKTYLGNPFSNNMLDIDGKADPLDWKKVSMKTLEGGEQAFGERGKIYGNS